MTPAELDADEARRKDDDLRDALSTPNGRRFVWRLIEGAGAVKASFAGDGTTTAYNEGRRAVGLALMLEAQRVDADAFVRMFSEQVAAASSATARRRQAEEAARKDE